MSHLAEQWQQAQRQGRPEQALHQGEPHQVHHPLHLEAYNKPKWHTPKSVLQLQRTAVVVSAVASQPVQDGP